MQRYVLLQAPGVLILVLVLILVRQWIGLSTLFICGLVALWVAKDLILFPFLWRAYDSDQQNQMIGTRGIAEERLAPSGYVYIHGELWQAEVMKGYPPIDRGETVRVRGINGLILLVQPDNLEG
jgi:membrane protein implicated in regulation of membrane protease activity